MEALYTHCSGSVKRVGTAAQSYTPTPSQARLRREGKSELIFDALSSVSRD